MDVCMQTRQKLTILTSTDNICDSYYGSPNPHHIAIGTEQSVVFPNEDDAVPEDGLFWTTIHDCVHSMVDVSANIPSDQKERNLNKKELVSTSI